MGDIFKIKRKKLLPGYAPFDTARVLENQYKIGDKVIYQGNYYVAIADNDAISPVDPSYWSSIGPVYGSPNANFTRGEMAFNEADQTLFYRASASTLEIGGQGGLIGSEGDQTITSNKLFTDAVSVSSLSADTPPINTNSFVVATTEFVKNVFGNIDGGELDENTLYFYSETSTSWTNLSSWYTDAQYTLSSSKLPDGKTNVIIKGIVTPVIINLDDEDWVTPLSIDRDIYGLTVYSENHARLNCNIYGTGVVTFSGNAQFNG